MWQHHMDLPLGTILYRAVLTIATIHDKITETMRKSLFASLLMMASLPAAAAYTGRVFVDKNGNGRFDKGERTLAGVMVSDGLNVVKTSAGGSFSLPGHAKARFIFITTPSGYKTDNAYYRRIETGTNSYDFGVTPYNSGIAAGGSHKFIHISDTEIHGSLSTDEHSDWLQNLRNCAANEHVAFIMHTGDICYESGLRNHIGMMNTHNMNVPVFYSIGNHDLVKGEYGEQLFEQIYGPVCYSFDAGSVHYIVTPMLGGDYRPSYTPDDVYRWVKNDLALVPKGKPVYVFGHNLNTYSDDFVFPIKGEEPLDLDAHNLKAWLYGHWHNNHIHKHKSAYSICSITPVRGGIDHSTASFRVMSIDGKGNFKSDLRYPYIDKSVKIASVNNLETIASANGTLPVSVNTYSSDSPVARVTVRCATADGKVVATTTLAQQTDFAWGGHVKLPATLNGQFLTLTATALFKDGETAMASSSFNYSTSHAAQPAPGADWTNLLGNAQHNNSFVDTKPLKDLRLAWVGNIGSNIFMTSPIVYGGEVYAASVDENYQGKAAIACFDGKTGTQKWKYGVKNSIKNTIVASDGLIFAQDTDGNLYAVNAKSGKLAWEKKLPIDGLLPALIDGLVCDKGIVYAGSGKGLCAIEAKTGKEIWRNKDWGRHEGSTPTFSATDSYLIGSTHWGALYCNDIKTGKCLWSLEKDGIRHRSSSAVMDGDMMYLASDESFFIIDARNGNILTRKKLPFSVNVASSPLVTDKEIIFGTASEGVVALDRESLDEKWRFRGGSAMVYTAPYFRNPSATFEASPVLAGTNVIIGGADGALYMLDRKTGQMTWRHETGAPILSAVAVSGNMVYATDYSGNIYGFVGQ